MSETPETPDTPRQRYEKEYEDHHFHDDDEVESGEDAQRGHLRPSAARKSPRKLLPRRHYDED